MRANTVEEKTTCYHCGDECANSHIHIEDKPFCCDGCKMVYEIINQNGLCEYYDITAKPGITQKIKVREGKFAFLDNNDVRDKLVHFSEGNQKHVTFYLPQMHCSSCIWLLEHLPKLNTGIINSQVNFLKKEVSIVFNHEKTSLRGVAELLSGIGYEPHISLNDFSGNKIKKYDKSRIYKIGVAGFCFGNIMLLSFPEYFSSGNLEDGKLKTLFSFLNLGLSLPVFFYCASEFFTSAYKSLKQRFLNIDAPIALAVLMAFGRSVYEICTFSGAGYLDSMSGIVFFMLIGRFFQDKTYQSLSFDRDYTSYFPLGVSIILPDGGEKQVPVSDIKKGDRIKIHSQEIIPADGILFLGKASIDYSFVTGESLPSDKGIGEIIYAGGKQTGGAIELEVIKEVSQSYLTQLWNNDTFKNKTEEKKVSFVHAVSRYFTYVLFTIALISGIYWSSHSNAKAWNAVTAILIVACPCALLLSATFTNGNMLAKLQRARFYVKNANTLENLSEADTIVFDKTGTISMQGEASIHFVGSKLSEYEEQLIRSLANQSNHPLSKAIVSALPLQKSMHVKNYVEEKGRGSSALVNGEFVKIGSAEYVTGSSQVSNDGSKVYVSVNHDILGCFVVKTKYREEIEHLIPELKQKYKLALISGDNNSEEQKLRSIFGGDTEMLFNQHPQDKLNYIKQLQEKGHKVVMIGDGLNDAGALQQSNAGIAVSDDINNFSPGCDAILDGKQFGLLRKLFDYCSKEKPIIYGSFIISILYNIIGLYFAVQGNLSPVIAAVLMPVSSASIMLYTTGMSSWYGRKLSRNPLN